MGSPLLTQILSDSPAKKTLLSWLPPAPADVEGSMDVDSTSKSNNNSEPVPEVEIYLRLLILHHLLSSEDTHEKALSLANDTVQKMQQLNRRSMDAIAAKVWYAVERAYDLAGELSDARPYVFSRFREECIL